MKKIKKHITFTVVSLAVAFSFPVTASAGPGESVILEWINAKLSAFAESNIGQFARSIEQAAQTFSEINVLNTKVGGLLDFTEEMYSGARAAEMSVDNIRGAVNAFYGLTEEAEMAVSELKIYTERGWLTSSEFQQHLLMVKYVVNDAGLEIKYLFNFTQGPLAPVARKATMSSVPVKANKDISNLNAEKKKLEDLRDAASEGDKGLYQANIDALEEKVKTLSSRSSYYGSFDYTDSQGNELNPFRNEDGTLRKDFLMGEGSKDGVITGLLKTVESRTEEIRQIAGRMQSRTEFLADQRNLIYDNVNAKAAIKSAEDMIEMMLPHDTPKSDKDSLWNAYLDNFRSRHQRSDADIEREKVELGRRLTGNSNLDEKTAKTVAEANEGTSFYTTSITERNEDAEAAAQDLKLSTNGIFTIIYVLLGIVAIFFGVQVVIKMNKGEKQSQDTMFKLLTGTLAAIIIITLFREILF